MTIPSRCKCGRTKEDGLMMEEKTISYSNPLIAPLWQCRVVCNCCGQATLWYGDCDDAVRAWNNLQESDVRDGK